MNDEELRKMISLIVTRLDRLDRILRIKEMEGLGGITTGGKKA